MCSLFFCWPLLVACFRPKTLAFSVRLFLLEFFWFLACVLELRYCFFVVFLRETLPYFIYFRNSYFIWLPVFQMHLKNYIKPFLIILLPHSLSKKITNLFLFILFCKFIFFFLSKISLAIFSYKKQKTIRFLFESDVLSFFSLA